VMVSFYVVWCCVLECWFAVLWYHVVWFGDLCCGVALDFYSVVFLWLVGFVF